MAVDVGTLIMRFEADDKKLNKGFTGIKKGIKGITKAAAVGAAAVGASLTGIATKSIKLAQEQEKAEARLEAIAKKVTKATDAQVKSLKNLAAETQKLTTFGDEVLITGQSQLLSFGLQADQVEQLTGSLADLLAANNGITASSDDAINAANILGKAFDGQVGSLSRVGILLDDASAEILKNGTAAEKTTELVKIMDENYGGLAETLAETSEGQLQQAKNSIGDVGEVIGNIFLPLVNKALEVVQENLPAIQEFFTNTFNKIVEFGTMAADFFNTNLLPIIEKFVSFIKENIPTTKTFFKNAFDEIVDVGMVLWEFFKDNILPIIEDLVDFVNENLPGMGKVAEDAFKIITEALGNTAEALQAGIDWIKKYKEILIPLASGLVAAGVAYGIYTTIVAVATVGMTALTAVTTAFTTVLAVLTSPITLVIAAIALLVAAGVALFRNWDEVSAFGKRLWEDIKVIFNNIKERVIGVIDAIINIFNDMWDTVKEVFNGIRDVITNVITDVKSVIDGIIGTITGLIDIFGSAIKIVKDFFKEKDKGDLSVPDVSSRSGRNPISGQRAFGGNVTAGQSFLVGERGTEVFTPSTGGTISSAGANITINVNGSQDPNMVANEIVKILAVQGITR